MKINANLFALSASITMGIGYAICALIVYVWPTHSLKLFADMMHLTSLKVLSPYFHVTTTNFISGLVQLIIYTYAFVYVWILIFNALNKKA